MKIYTKTGDDGQTGLFGGARVSKSAPRVEAYGCVDELNSVLGLVRVRSFDEAVDAELATIQSELFDIGAELATVPGRQDKLSVPLIDDGAVERLERAIDASEAALAPLKTFVLPGGCEAAALLHLARTVCRRGERRIVALSGDEAARPVLVRYVNRLSDLLFSWARLANLRAGVVDVPWRGRERAT